MNYILLLSISIIWGGQFMLIKNALLIYTPEDLAFLRTFFAGVFLVIMCLSLKRKQHKRDIYNWSKVIAIAIFEIVIPFTLIMWGQKYLASSTTAVIMGSIPIFTLTLVIILKIEQATLDKAVSMVMGFTGVAILVLSDTFTLETPENILLPKLAILIGSMSFAMALVMIKNMPNESALLLSRDTFLVGSIILFLYNNIIEREFIGCLIMKFSLWPFISAVILGSLCSGLVYVLYVTLIKNAGASFCSLSNYLVPLFGSIFGMIFMNESIKPQIIIGSLLITLSIAIRPLFNLTQKTKKDLKATYLK